MLFTELNTNVLLHIYGRLDPIDSINLAETCTRLRDVAQLHYKRFKTLNLDDFFFNETDVSKRYRHNRIDATTVLKHIGPFISDLAADLDVNAIESIISDVGASIRKYCVNVKTLKIYGGIRGQPVHNPYSVYFDWLRKLNLTKISISFPDLYLIDLPETTTLEELHIRYNSCDQYFPPDFGRVANILERNVNITCLRIQLIRDFKYEIFEKLKCLKRLVLAIEYDESLGQLEKVSANLKMTTLEKVELVGHRKRGVDGLNEFLQKLSENAVHLKHLSIGSGCALLDAYPLSSLPLLNLTSLRWIDEHPNLYKEIPKIQPNLTHLDLIIYEGKNIGLTSYIGGTLPKPMEQIVFLIKNLEKLELLHIRFFEKTNISSTLKDFLQESVHCRIFDCHAINRRRSVTLRFFQACVPSHGCFLQVELYFSARKWTWTIMKESYPKLFVENQLLLPFFDSSDETFDDFSAVQRFSGTASDLNAVRDEAIKWIERLMCTTYRTW